MRLVLVSLLLALAACPSGLDDQAAEGDDNAGGGGGAGSDGAGTAAECYLAADCVPAGPKCCDCPTHAVPVTDPAHLACENVDCPTMTCGSPMEAACISGQCELVCSAVACTPNASCADGFATDANGCLTCECAAPTASECAVDGDCARVRDDCCGCMLGGADTAIPASEVAAHEAQLMCPTDPVCPGVDTCAPDLAARCVAGQCTLVSGALPADACGRPDLAACPSGEVCTVNADDQATMQGVGVCRPAP
jgi:hypothetical protein